jgi:excinuclease UvrABC helicase subunit UvrB
MISSRYKLGKITVAEAIIRPTGLLDPEIQIKPVDNQVDDVLEQVRDRITKGQRVLITTLTKKFAEELDLYLKQIGVKSAYIHSDVETLDRVDILADLRRGKYDVLIGINLLREGLDLPEVSLVAIFDADKEGFLRSKTSLIQIIGRAARHFEGKVIMYAQNITKSMQYAIDETNRRRALQMEYNQIHNITPQSTKRELQTIVDDLNDEVENNDEYGKAGAEWTVNGFANLDEFVKVGGSRKGVKLGKNSDDTNGNRSGRKSKAKQVYEDFEATKETQISDLASQNYSKEDLEKLMQKAINEMDFEKAAAIRDLLNLS